MKQKSLILIIVFTFFISSLIYWIYYTGPQGGKSLPVCTRLPRVDIKPESPHEIFPNKDSRWKDNSIIDVYFEDGINDFTNKVIATANEWYLYCGIEFRITDIWAKAEIKTTFRKGGYASAVGRECLQEEYDTDFTMYLQGIDTLRDQKEFRRVILHEFGHALGIEHELSKPSAVIPWNKEEVYNYYDSKYNWSRSEVDQNIFFQLQPSSKEYEEFDPTSIMVYGVKPPLTIPPYSIPWPTSLSATDKTGIAKWYPKKKI